MLCPSTSRQQRPRTVSYTVSLSNRHLNQMVARKTGTTCPSLALTLVTYSKPSTPLETIPSEVAPRGVIIPSPMSQPILQNGSKWSLSNMQLYSTNSVTTNRPSLPGQVVEMPVLLQTLAEIQGSSSQSVRSSLGSGRISPSLAASS